jgi:SPOR domain
MALGVDPDDRMPAARTKAANGWQRHFGALVRVSVVLVVLGAAGASIWPYFKAHFLPAAAPSGPVPVIGPGNEPIKEPPKQPGGMQVPDQDKIILNGAAARPKVEQILPPPPAPLPAPAPPAAVQAPPPAAAPLPAAPAGASTAVAAPAVAAPPRTIEAPPPQTVAAAPKPVAPLVSAAAPKPKAEPAPVIARESAPTQLAGRGWFIQLGAMRSTVSAQAEWTRLKRAQPDLLGSLRADAVRIDHNGIVLYRIEAGPLADPGAASQLCRSLLARHVACIVLRP